MLSGQSYKTLILNESHEVENLTIDMGADSNVVSEKSLLSFQAEVSVEEVVIRATERVMESDQSDLNDDNQ